MYILVAATFAALSGIVMMVLVGWFGLKRGALNVRRRDGGNPKLVKRIRNHGNFVENAPSRSCAWLQPNPLGVNTKVLPYSGICVLASLHSRSSA